MTVALSFAVIGLLKVKCDYVNVLGGPHLTGCMLVIVQVQSEQTTYETSVVP